VAVLVTALYSFGLTMVLLWVADRLIGLRVTDDEEGTGLDLSLHREVAYTWTERAGFPAHLATVPDMVLHPGISLDEIADPALD
jgi:hypothetical protein